MTAILYIFVEKVLAPFLGILVGMYIKARQRQSKKGSFWSGVEIGLRVTLDDPNNPISDPEVAAEKALVAAHKPELEAVVRRLKESVPPPASEKQVTDDHVTTAKIPTTLRAPAETSKLLWVIYRIPSKDYLLDTCAGGAWGRLEAALEFDSLQEAFVALRTADITEDEGVIKVIQKPKVP